jgi:hypothetical protein
MTRSDRVATLEEAKAQFQEELGRLEGRERSWKRLLTSLSLLARLPHWRRFFENLLRGVAPLRRGRYHRGWSNICGRNGGLGNDVIGDFGDTSAQSQEAKRCVLPQILDALQCKASRDQPLRERTVPRLLQTYTI